MSYILSVSAAGMLGRSFCDLHADAGLSLIGQQQKKMVLLLTALRVRHSCASLPWLRFHDGSRVEKHRDKACEWPYAGATTRYSVALGRWVWNSGEDATPTICRSEECEASDGIANTYINTYSVYIQTTLGVLECPSHTFHGALMFSLLSQLLTVESAFSAICPY